MATTICVVNEDTFCVSVWEDYVMRKRVKQLKVKVLQESVFSGEVKVLVLFGVFTCIKTTVKIVKMFI